MDTRKIFALAKNRKVATHETLCTNQLVLRFILRSLGEGGRSA